MCWKWRRVKIFLILLFLASLPVQSKIHLILAIDNSEAVHKIDPDGYRWESVPLAIDQLQVGDGLEIINLSNPSQPLVNKKILTGHFSQKDQLKKNLDNPSKRNSDLDTKEGLQYLLDRLDNPTQYKDPPNRTGLIVLAHRIEQLDFPEHSSTIIKAISLKELENLQTPVELLTRVSQLLNQMHGYTVSVAQTVTKLQPFGTSSFLVYDPRIEEIQVQYLFKSGEELPALEVRDALGEFVYHYAESKNFKLYTIPNPPLGNWKVMFQNLDQVSQVISAQINDKVNLPELVFEKPEEKQWPIELRVQAGKSFESAGIAMHLDVLYATIRLPDNTDQQLQLTSDPSALTPSFSAVYTPLENGDYYITIDPSAAYVVTPPRRLVEVVPSAKPNLLPLMLAVLLVVGTMTTGGVMVLGAMRQREQDNAEFFMSDDFADLELKEDDATTTSEKQADAFLDPKIATPSDVEEFIVNDAQTVATLTENMESVINTEADEAIMEADLEEELKDLVGYDDILQLIQTSSEDDEEDIFDDLEEDNEDNEANEIWQESSDSAEVSDSSDFADDDIDSILGPDDEDDFDHLDDIDFDNLDLGLDNSDVEEERLSLSDTNDDQEALSTDRLDAVSISESPTTSIDAKDRESDPGKLTSATNTLSSDLEATEEDLTDGVPETTELEELPNQEDSLKLESESNENGINDLITSQSQAEALKDLLASREPVLDSNDASEDDNIDPVEHDLALEAGLEEKIDNENTNLLELIDPTADQESESSLLGDLDPIEKIETETSDLEVPGEKLNQEADLVDQIDLDHPTDEPEPVEISAQTSAPADDLSLLEGTTALGDGLSLDPVPAEQNEDTNTAEILPQGSPLDENDNGDDSSLDSIMDMISDDDNDPLAALLAETEEPSADISPEEPPAEEEFHDLVEEWPELQVDADASSVDEEFEEPNFESEPLANPIESGPDQLENEVTDQLNPADVTSAPVARANQIGAQLDNEPAEGLEPVKSAPDQQTKAETQPDDVADEELQNLLHQIEAISEDNSDQLARNPVISDQTELRSRPTRRHRSRADQRRSSNYPTQTSESEVSASRQREAKKEQTALTDIDEVLAAIDRLRETD